MSSHNSTSAENERGMSVELASVKGVVDNWSWILELTKQETVGISSVIAYSGQKLDKQMNPSHRLWATRIISAKVRKELYSYTGSGIQLGPATNTLDSFKTRHKNWRLIPVIQSLECREWIWFHVQPRRLWIETVNNNQIINHQVSRL